MVTILRHFFITRLILYTSDKSTVPNVQVLKSVEATFPSLTLSFNQSICKIYIARSKADSVKLNLPRLAGKKTFSGPGNREVRPGVIYDWKDYGGNDL